MLLVLSLKLAWGDPGTSGSAADADAAGLESALDLDDDDVDDVDGQDARGANGLDDDVDPEDLDDLADRAEAIEEANAEANAGANAGANVEADDLELADSFARSLPVAGTEEAREGLRRRSRSKLGRIDVSLIWRRTDPIVAAARDEVWLLGTWRP